MNIIQYNQIINNNYDFRKNSNQKSNEIKEETRKNHRESTPTKKLNKTFDNPPKNIKYCNKDSYNLPLKERKEIKRTNSVNQTISPGEKSIEASIDKKTNCIEYLESRVKNYFDQNNTKKEQNDFIEAFLPYQHQRNNHNLSQSRDSLNTSQVSNVFEKSPSTITIDYPNQIKSKLLMKGHLKQKV